MSIQAQITRTLSQSASLSAADLHLYQLRLLERLCRHAATHVSRYRETLSGMFAGNDPAAGEWNPAGWAGIPIVSRADMVADPAGFQSAGMNAGEYQAGETSGSTGASLSYRKSVIGNFASIGVADRAFRKFGFDLAGKFADIRVLLLTDEERGQRRRWNASADSGEQCLFEIRRPVADQWAWLKTIQPDYLMSYPSNLRALSKLALDEPCAVRLKACVGSAEILTDDVRNLIRSAFDVETLSLYGLRELGHVATSCPTTGQLHIAADVTMVEIIRDDGGVAGEGEAGQIVATSLYNHAMPFIRYATGDYAEVGGACDCGWSLPTLKRILGRARNRFTLGDGRRIWPALLLERADTELDLGDFQLIQIAPEAFEFRYVRPAGQGDLDQTEAAAHLSSKFQRDVMVTANRMSHISPSGYAKQERFISMLD